MFNTRYIQGILVLIIGLFLSVWLGLSIVTNQAETVIQIIAALVLITCLFLGRRIWLLIPFTAALEIGLRIPGQPNSLLLGQVLVLVFSTLLFLMRKLPFRLAWTELETWLLLLTLCIGQAYLRNPVSVSIFGGDTVGGKPYALYGIALLTAILFCGLRVPARELKLILPLSIIGGLLNAFIAVIGIFFPAVAYYTGASFARTDETNYENIGQPVNVGAAGRIGYLTTLGRNLSLWISAFISPLRALLNPISAILLLVALVSVMFGGFRSGMVWVGFVLMLGIYYRSGGFGLVIAAFGGVAGLVLLAFVNLVAPLPPNIQRTLTILPGTWEQRYRDDAEGSTDWRVEVWVEALTSERWIQNKALGDGMGFNADDLAKSFTMTRAGAISGFDLHREQVLINGDYHSVIVSTIRTCGYAGLLVFVLATIRLAVRAHRLIRRHRSDEWFPLCLFVGIPLVIGPVWLLVSASNFGNTAATFILGVAMIRLLENNLPLPQEQAPASPSTFVPTANRRRELVASQG
jgi:hypothetical protein